MPAFRDLVLIGRVIKPQGRRGEVVIEPLSDRPGRFPALVRAFVPGPAGEPREVRVESGRPHKGRWVLKLEGVSSIDDAERLRGLELRISESELDPLPEGSYYYHHLTGLRVVDREGAALGVVEDVMETGGETKVLVVRGAGGETLLPFARTFVKAVDLAGGTIVVERPEYVVAD
jgi:16S rRNA processing protein RimM